MPKSKAEPKSSTEETPLFSQKQKFRMLDAVQNVFLSKSTLNFIGFILKVAIVCSITGTPFKEDEVPLLPPSLIAYAVLIIVVVIIRETVNYQKQNLDLDESRQHTVKAFLGGLNLIPAWGFKDCVSACIAGQPWWAGLIVLVVATVLAIILDPPPLERTDCVETFIFSLRKTMAGCMPLGVGFALGKIPFKICRILGYNCQTIPMLLTYAVIITVLMVLMQTGLMLVKTDKHYQKTFLKFVSLSGNFVAAWAWDGFLDSSRREILALNPDDCGSKAGINLAWALMVLCIALGVIVLVYRSSEDPEESTLQKGLRALMIIVCAGCVCWSFLDLLKGIYWCISWGSTPFLLAIWIFAIITSVLGALLLIYGNQGIENAKKDI